MAWDSMLLAVPPAAAPLADVDASGTAGWAMEQACPAPVLLPMKSRAPAATAARMIKLKTKPVRRRRNGCLQLTALSVPSIAAPGASSPQVSATISCRCSCRAGELRGCFKKGTLLLWQTASNTNNGRRLDGLAGKQ